MAKGKKFGVGSGYSMLGPGDVFGEVAFFTEVPQLEVRRGTGEEAEGRQTLNPFRGGGGMGATEFFSDLILRRWESGCQLGGASCPLLKIEGNRLTFL